MSRWVIQVCLNDSLNAVYHSVLVNTTSVYIKQEPVEQVYSMLDGRLKVRSELPHGPVHCIYSYFIYSFVTQIGLFERGLTISCVNKYVKLHYILC